ncbi:MAG: FKBP-type peptidyl-prolyl cis-trans isomerase [Gemmatimonadaceae bacterium]|nr:FKBP-type peptidyl-prolyl cis-trans isomerase [Gemmatimonadaceae bacterium]
MARLSMAVVLVACASRPALVPTPSGLQYRVLSRGDGPAAVPGQRVTIHETTTLPSGRLIYTSRSGAPITFLLGGGQVIAGVDEGVTGMRVGERRLLVVPPALSRRTGYPANTPPDSTLHIDVELVALPASQATGDAAGPVTIVRSTSVIRRDSSGRAIPTGSSIDRDSRAQADAVNARVRVLQVEPDRLVARVGDTLSPFIALHVSGLDSAGVLVPRVVPLLGPIPAGSSVRQVGNGRWLAAKPGTTTVQVRVMRFAQPARNDTALVRSVRIDVVP